MSAYQLLRPRFRFVYFATSDVNSQREAYHHHLVMAEVLLERVFAAHAAGLYPIVPTLTRGIEARATHRPPRQMLHAGTLEYRRWYDSHGKPRVEPLTQEALAEWLVATEGTSMQQALAHVASRSRALGDVEQRRLIERRHAATEKRPLDQIEFRWLVEALDSVCRVPPGAPKIERANREIARRAAAVLGDMLQDFIASPFVTSELDHAFSRAHVERLRRTIESSRQSESLRVGPRAWFAAKAARMRAEHQVGMAMTPVLADARARFRVASLRVRVAVNRSLQHANAG